MTPIKDLPNFTFNKPVIIIIILVLLAIVVIPKFFRGSGDANASSEKSVVGAVRVGIQTYYAQHNDYPATLDSATNGTCTSGNVCFSVVLSKGGVTSNWKKAGFSYTGPNGGAFTYVPAMGFFK